MENYYRILNKKHTHITFTVNGVFFTHQHFCTLIGTVFFVYTEHMIIKNTGCTHFYFSTQDVTLALETHRRLERSDG